MCTKHKCGNITGEKPGGGWVLWAPGKKNKTFMRERKSYYNQTSTVMLYAKMNTLNTLKKKKKSK